jgi:hypothetical protein
MKIIHPVSRRAVLRGVGTTLCLPLLESFLPRSAFGAPAKKPPQRLIFLSYSWGVAEQDWFPSEAGANFSLPRCLEPLERHRGDFSILNNLTNKRASNGHWGCTTWLTSADVSGTPGKAFQNTVSVDQVAARTLGAETRFESLELSCPKGDGFGPGLSLAWSPAGSAIAGETSPVALFDRLFGATEVPLEERRYRLLKDQSVLDAVLYDAKIMHGRLGKSDREKVDEYFQSVRDIERRISKAKDWLDRPLPKAPFSRPKGTTKTSEEIRVMYDLMVAAIQTDMTRVLTYRQPVEGLIKELGYKFNAHSTTHCTLHGEKYQASIKRDQKQLELVAHLIDRLKSLRDPDGSTVFDNTLITYGSGIRTNHHLTNTPTLVAGHGGGGVKQGQHIVYESNQTPLANLWHSVLQHVGIKAERFADSEGRLSGLFT